MNQAWAEELMQMAMLEYAKAKHSFPHFSTTANVNRGECWRWWVHGGQDPEIRYVEPPSAPRPVRRYRRGRRC